MSRVTDEEYEYADDSAEGRWGAAVAPLSIKNTPCRCGHILGEHKGFGKCGHGWAGPRPVASIDECHCTKFRRANEDEPVTPVSGDAGTEKDVDALVERATNRVLTGWERGEAVSDLAARARERDAAREAADAHRLQWHRLVDEHLAAEADRDRLTRRIAELERYRAEWESEAAHWHQETVELEQQLRYTEGLLNTKGRQLATANVRVAELEAVRQAAENYLRKINDPVCPPAIRQVAVDALDEALRLAGDGGGA